jgi:IS5 family transposase
VETELKCTRYGQNKVLKLTILKRRLCGHQKRLKQIKDGEDMAKTRFRGLSARNQGLKHDYV